MLLRDGNANVNWQAKVSISTHPHANETCMMGVKVIWCKPWQCVQSFPSPQYTSLLDWQDFLHAAAWTCARVIARGTVCCSCAPGDSKWLAWEDMTSLSLNNGHHVCEIKMQKLGPGPVSVCQLQGQIASTTCIVPLFPGTGWQHCTACSSPGGAHWGCEAASSTFWGWYWPAKQREWMVSKLCD